MKLEEVQAEAERRYHHDAEFRARVDRGVDALDYSIRDEDPTYIVAIGVLMAELNPQTEEPQEATDESSSADSLHEDLRHVFNKHSVENGANIPDTVIATYTIECIKALNTAVRRQNNFFGFEFKFPFETPQDVS